LEEFKKQEGTNEIVALQSENEQTRVTGKRNMESWNSDIFNTTTKLQTKSLVQLS